MTTAELIKQVKDRASNVKEKAYSDLKCYEVRDELERREKALDEIVELCNEFEEDGEDVEGIKLDVEYWKRRCYDLGGWKIIPIERKQEEGGAHEPA